MGDTVIGRAGEQIAETARTATINSVSFLVNHTFKSGHR